jgi:hypothetical protein
MKAHESLSVVNDHEAVTLYTDLCDYVEKVDRNLSFIDKKLRKLLRIRNSHKINGFSTRIDMLNSIFENKQNAYMLYDMANKVYVEYVIGKRKYDWKQSSLLDLYHRADEDDWRKIADLAEKQAGGQKRPTAKIVNAAIKSFYGHNDNELEASNNSKSTPKNGNNAHHVSKEDDKKRLDDSGNKEKPNAQKTASCAERSSNDAGNSKKVVQLDTSDHSRSERMFKKQLQMLSNFTRKEKKKVLNMLDPSDDAGKVAKNIIIYANDDQYDEVVEKLLDELGE